MDFRHIGFAVAIAGSLLGCGSLPSTAPVADAPAGAEPTPVGGSDGVPDGGTGGSGAGGLSGMGAAGTGEVGGGGDVIGAGGGSASGNQASLLAWNLENFPHTDTAFAQAVELLGALAPDVVGLQEIADDDAFYDLLDALPGYDGFLNWDAGSEQRLGMLFKASRVTVRDIETIYRDDWYAFPRPPLTAHVTIDSPIPIDFIMVVVHLKAMLDDESQDRRREGCARLDTWVRAKQQTGAEQDLVLLGDFNDQLTDPPEWNVFTPFLDAPDVYRALTLPLAEAGEHSYIPFESLIDHVFVTSDMLQEVGDGQTEVLALEQLVDGYESLTDHRPVRTWLRW